MHPVRMVAMQCKDAVRQRFLRCDLAPRFVTCPCRRVDETHGYPEWRERLLRIAFATVSVPQAPP